MDENEKLINNIKATMGFEGFILEESDIDIIKSYLKSDITKEQGIDIIKNEFKEI